ncbi:hypothetical protein GU926_18020 [Nibribacter ruber]|uniref:Uncharacterized protein n=1 Tax=Nibribacter ruber TaxID=2698458 RepID=A0A6P1P448_9BACT|nr:hypothetical protein [Nibribacter ruber]QHL89224.1 hypothetical protein GU926_18020 [Nibribacter ruber]
MMMDLEKFTELAAALSYIQELGFTHTFRCHGQQLVSLETRQAFSQDRFLLVACHRFRTGAHKDLRVVLYAVEGPEGAKGIVLDDCQSYGDNCLGNFLVKLKMCQLPPAQDAKPLPPEKRLPPFRRAS